MHKGLLFGLLSLTLASCSVLSPITAAANLADASGQVTGKATFAQEGAGTRVNVSVTGLKPGMHGMHIHVNPACTNTTDTSGATVVFGGAGGHFDPGSSNNHDAPTTDNTKGHGGDIPMINVGNDGVGTANFLTTKISLSGDNSAIGRSIVIHADQDDYSTDPAGNSGARERCGIISRS